MEFNDSIMNDDVRKALQQEPGQIIWRICRVWRF